MAGLEERTRYDPTEAEPRVVERWLASGLFHPEPAGTAEENFSIAVPPPNVTGALHIGHALNGSVQDTLIRFHRVKMSSIVRPSACPMWSEPVTFGGGMTQENGAFGAAASAWK